MFSILKSEEVANEFYNKYQRFERRYSQSLWRWKCLTQFRVWFPIDIVSQARYFFELTQFSILLLSFCLHVISAKNHSLNQEPIRTFLQSSYTLWQFHHLFIKKNFLEKMSSYRKTFLCFCPHRLANMQYNNKSRMMKTRRFLRILCCSKSSSYICHVRKRFTYTRYTFKIRNLKPQFVYSWISLLFAGKSSRNSRVDQDLGKNVKVRNSNLNGLRRKKN